MKKTLLNEISKLRSNSSEPSIDQKERGGRGEEEEEGILHGDTSTVESVEAGLQKRT